MREKIMFHENWRFHLGDFEEPRNRWAWGKSGSWNQGPESRQFDDRSWREVELPHDFVIEGDPVPYMVNEFDDQNNVIPQMQSVNNCHTTAGSFVKDVGWYRKHFQVGEKARGKKLFLIFEGIYRDCTIFLNDFFIEKHQSGYTGIVCDISDFVLYEEENVLSVRVDSRQPEGWFYEGGGIYRSAYLLMTEQTYIEDVFITATPDLADRSARVALQLWVKGMQEAVCTDCRIQLFDEKGRLASEQNRDISGDTEAFEFSLKDVSLWDIEDPCLYTAVCRLYDGEALLDEYVQEFGIRQSAFDPDKGFFLNGRRIKLNGVCCHQNHGGLGSALPDEMYNYRISKLKELGANAYRTSHYPPSPALLRACDRLGMLVMDENRLFSSAREDLEQLEYMVREARNHPSVILYSIGNEEAQSQASRQNARIASSMIRKIKELDPTRPVTMGLLMWDLAKKCMIRDVTDIARISEQLDVAGFNYQDWHWDTYHSLYPHQPMICTEQGTFKSTRGCYETKLEEVHLSIIDKQADSYMKGAGQWRSIEKEYMSGGFVWTGFDYYGEPTPFAWPAISSQFGIMDLCGYPKDFYYFYRGCWKKEPLVHVFPHWNGVPGEKKDLHVFSNCEEVELYVNGRSLGRKVMEPMHYLEWENVTFTPGSICVKGYRGGEPVTRKEVVTTGKAAKAVMTLDYQENDLAVIQVAVTDRQGSVVPDADSEISFRLEGRGRILGMCNGDPLDHTNVHSLTRRAFHGLLQVIVKGQGKMILHGEAEGLAPGTLEFVCAKRADSILLRICLRKKGLSSTLYIRKLPACREAF